MLPRLLNPIEKSEVTSYCFKNYGVPEQSWHCWDLVKRKEALWLFPKDFYEEFSGENIEVQGLRVFSGKEYPYKVTFAFASIFESMISKGVIELDEALARCLLFRKDFCPMEKELRTLPKRYYFFSYHRKLLGIFLKAEDLIISQVPKKFTAQLPRNLELGDE